MVYSKDDIFAGRGHANPARREALLREYAEVSNLFRTLTDIRFRLLGILPIASGVTAALGTRTQSSDEIGVPFALALFGLASAVGVVTYNARNDQLYNELIGRGASIERSLGLPDGAFSNRPNAWLRHKFDPWWLRGKLASWPRLRDKLGPWTWRIEHGQGIATIYAATIAFWLYLSIDAALHLAVPPLKSALWTTIPALAATILIMRGAWRLVRCQREARDCALRKDVLTAVDLLAACDNDLSRVMRNHSEFLTSCAEALGKPEALVSRRARFYSKLTPEALSYYAMTGSKLHKTASLVSLLTDLPPLWILDLAVNRRGTQPCGWKSSLDPVQWDNMLAEITARDQNG